MFTLSRVCSSDCCLAALILSDGCSVPTKKDVELRLAGQELEEEDLSTAGEAAWLAAGLRLEERK